MLFDFVIISAQRAIDVQTTESHLYFEVNLQLKCSFPFS